MSRYYRAVATDFDGTLTEVGRTEESLLLTFDKIRRSGRVVVLVSGRTLADLEATDNRIGEHVDAIVAENGAVFKIGGEVKLLAAPIAHSLVRAVQDRGVEVAVGEVLVATQAKAEAVVWEEIRNLGLDYQLVRNREQLMILPAGVTKGTGLHFALGRLGISRHSAIGIGDAENDHALLDACELRVAVNNAVPALKEHADIVLEEPGGAGVGAFLESQFFTSGRDDKPRRSVMIGTDKDGNQFGLPAAHRNILVSGEVGSGKSYTTGLVAEKLVQAGYSILLIDPEGDHVQLEGLPGVLTVGNKIEMGPRELVKLFDHRFTSVVLDMSQQDEQAKRAYMGELAADLENRRVRSGLPHWVVIDEAHAEHFGGRKGPAVLVRPSHRGYLLSTYLPGELSPAVWDEIDLVIATSPSEELASLVETYMDIPKAGAMVGLQGLKKGEVALLDREQGSIKIGQLLPRRIIHRRHWHKYVESSMAEWRRFYFREEAGGPIVAEAGNLKGFVESLEAVSHQCLRFHGRRGDFLRWLGGVLGDGELAEAIRGMEERLALDEDDFSRAEMVGLIRMRYGMEWGGLGLAGQKCF